MQRVRRIRNRKKGKLRILDKQRRKRWEIFVVLKEIKEAVKKHQEFLFHFNLRFCFDECLSKDFTAECLLKCVLKVPLLNGFCAEKLLVLTARSVIS